MKWVTSTDLKQWAETRDSQGTMPELIRNLIRATTKTINHISFPSGDNVTMGGLDGVLDIPDKTEFLPGGNSVWEFSSGSNKKGKADENYDKRTADSLLSLNKKECTFIFVTPRIWKTGQKWADEKKLEKNWKNVMVIDAVILEEWIETAPAVSCAFAVKHLGKYPPDGVQPTDHFWAEWSCNQLKASILLGGRDKQTSDLTSSLQTSVITPVQGLSREESIAFIIAAFTDNPEKKEDFFARSLIIDSPDVFRRLSALSNPLILIPRFEDTNVLNHAISKGHKVLMPLGPDSANSWSDKIILPELDRDIFISSLAQIGIPTEQAEKLSRETTRNITILRRYLKLDRNIPQWAKPENIRDIIPALLMGRWDENNTDDTKFIGELAGMDYDRYSTKLNLWLNKSDSPIIKIGSFWRISSPLDAWNSASKSLVKKDFEILRSAFLEVLGEINPAFDLEPEKRCMADLYGKRRKFSKDIREGISQSLIMVSLFGKQLKLDLPAQGDVWVDNVVRELLSSDDPLKWKSFSSKFSLIAEASPSQFLAALENKLKNNNEPILKLFEEEPGIIIPQVHHTGLLWGLETVAWLPEYFSRACLVLAKLSSSDPGGTLSNRPFNSLLDIFRAWNFQTLSKLDERMQVMELMFKHEFDIAWKLSIKTLPNFASETGNYTHKPKWRLFNQELKSVITWQEIWDTHTAVIEILIRHFDFSEKKYSELLRASTTLGPIDRERVLTFLEPLASKINQVDYLPWHTTREILNHHRSFPKTKGSLNKKEVDTYQRLYNLLEPKDTIKKYVWLFNTNHPVFQEGYERAKITHQRYAEIVETRRLEAITLIYNQYGITKLVELSNEVTEPFLLGDGLGHINTDEKEMMLICELLKQEEKNVKFAQGFIGRKSILNGVDWVFELYSKLNNLNFTAIHLANIFLIIRPSKQLWDFIDGTNPDLIQSYWTRVNHYFFHEPIAEKIRGINNLMKFKRCFTALDCCSYIMEELPTNIIAETLQKAVSEPTDESITSMGGYHIGQLFEELDTRDDLETEKMIKLEWMYLPLLAAHGNKRSPKRLHEQLAKDPAFFVDVLKLIFYPDDRTLIEAERIGRSDEEIRDRARRTDELLNGWHLIPGVDESGNINETLLNNWIDEARRLAIEHHRVLGTDIRIGKMLAHYPEDSDNWPPEEICRTIERLNNEKINIHFYTETRNKGGFSSRKPFDGGERERNIALHYRTLADKHLNIYPTVATLLIDVARSYEEDGIREDERAHKDILEY